MGVETAIIIGIAAATAGASIHQSTQQKKAAKKEARTQAHKSNIAKQELQRKRASLGRLASSPKQFGTEGGILGEELMKTQVGRLGQIK